MRVRHDSGLLKARLYHLGPEQYWGLPTPLSFVVGDDYVIHYYTEGERLDQLAAEYYRNPLLWWVLAEVNLIAFPCDLESGMPLRIPTLETLGRLMSL